MVHMEFIVKKRLFLLDDNQGRFRVEQKVIRGADGSALVRLICFNVSELLTDSRLFLDPPLFKNSFDIVREALATRNSLEMVELLSLFVGLRKVAKRIVVWDQYDHTKQMKKVFAFAGQKLRRYRYLHILKDEEEELSDRLSHCGFIRIEGTAIWVGGGLCGRVRGKLRVEINRKSPKGSIS